MKQGQRIAIGVGIVGIGAGIAYLAMRKPAVVEKKGTGDNSGKGGAGSGSGKGSAGSGGAGSGGSGKVDYDAAKGRIKGTVVFGGWVDDPTYCQWGGIPAKGRYYCKGAPPGALVKDEQECQSRKSTFAPPGVPLFLCI
jgi:hypothetical protein